MAFIEPCFGIGHNLSLICQMTSEDIKHQLIISYLKSGFLPMTHPFCIGASTRGTAETGALLWCQTAVIILYRLGTKLCHIGTALIDWRTFFCLFACCCFFAPSLTPSFFFFFFFLQLFLIYLCYNDKYMGHSRTCGIATVSIS